MEKQVKEITLYRTNLVIGDPDEEGLLSEETKVNRVILNEDGHEIERITYNAYGEPEERVIIKWENGHPVEEQLELEGEIAERTTREFDDKGRIVKEFRHYLEGGTDEIRYIYENDLLIMKQTIDSDGDEGEKHYWTYEDGLLVKEESFDADGEPEMRKNYIYAENGRLDETIELQISNDGESKLVSVMDEAGNIVLEKRYDTRGNLIARNTITIGENGRPALMEEETVRGKSVVHLEYDGQGNNVLYREETADGNLLTLITRTFDTEGRNTGSEVKTEPQAQRPGQHYRLRYEYNFYE
ncbi:hypothetical protein [Lentimicrobium sp.]|uniref:hypothetical protein n=1 Tax=Lentimicrobium sp. TaxID=2034841 RepID=UPI0025DD4747|nr:hypothetical protein [Lentimicrobium sp.]MCO5256280.1 hypothetical protein [Lentimicrobium sp.]MCO5262497.1 hypothetical protein [Lentimicrobium sp.]HPF63911.1 hypothetical protein [Lentimicrobium sp.]HPJ61235.1 hypothetical protein [Lentimicrobium sp.]HPR25196.1 hypothetical protein [Lentimicrobium sp.]